MMYDVVVVGARCAGAPSALLFARAGYRVLLVDRMRFPSDTISTHHVHRTGLRLLGEWGVLDRLVEGGCPPVRRLVYHVGDVRIAGPLPATDGIDATYAPRRKAMDEQLVRVATAARAEFRDGCTVTGVVFENGRAAGIRWCDHRGRQGVEPARLVVGADGMRSSVAEKVGALTEAASSPMTCVYYGYWEGVPADLEIYEQPRRLVGAVRTHDGLTLVVCYFPQEEFAAIRRRPRSAYLDAVRATAPDLAERMSAGRQVERLRGTGSQLNFFRQAAGPGWALVGDAGHCKDSITGTGITDAFRQAALLVDCVGADLHDDRALTRALRRFASERRRLFEDGYHATLTTARLTLAEERLAHLRFIQADPAATDLFIAIAVGAAKLPTQAAAGGDGAP